MAMTMDNTTGNDDIVIEQAFKYSGVIEQAFKYSGVIDDLLDIIHRLDNKINEVNKRLENAELATV